MGIMSSKRRKRKVVSGLQGGTNPRMSLRAYTKKRRRQEEPEEGRTFMPRFIIVATTTKRRVGIPSVKTDLLDLGPTEAIQTKLTDDEMKVVEAFLRGEDFERLFPKTVQAMTNLYLHLTFLMLKPNMDGVSLEDQIVRRVVASLDLNIDDVWKSLSEVEQQHVTDKSEFLRTNKEFKNLPARFAKIVGLVVHLCPAMSKYATLMIPPNQFVVRTTNAMLYARLHTIGESQMEHQAPSIQVPPHVAHHASSGNTMFQDVLPDVLVDKMLNQEVYTFWQDRQVGHQTKRHLFLQAKTWQQDFGEVYTSVTEFSTCSKFVFVCTMTPDRRMALVLVDLSTKRATPCTGFRARRGDVVDLHNLMQDFFAMPERPKLCCSGQLVCIPKTDQPSGMVVIDFRMERPMAEAAPTGWYTFIPSQVVWQGNIASNADFVAWITPQGIAMWRASEDQDALEVFGICENEEHDKNVTLHGMTLNGKYLIAGEPFVNREGEVQGIGQRLVKVDVQAVLAQVAQEEPDEQEQVDIIHNLSGWIVRPFAVSCTDTTIRVVYQHKNQNILADAQLEDSPNWRQILNFGEREVHQVALPALHHASYWTIQDGVMRIVATSEPTLSFEGLGSNTYGGSGGGGGGGRGGSNYHGGPGGGAGY